MRKLLLSAALLLVAQAAFAAELHQTIDRTFDVRPGADVELSNVNGRITVKAWDQPRVRVVAVKKVEAPRDDLQKAMNELRVEMQPRNGGLVITTRYPQEHDGGSFFGWLFGDNVEAQVTYELTVPRTMNVSVENTNGGIYVTEVTGKHDLDTTNGRIEVTRCAGSVDAATTNGSIQAELVRVTGKEPMRFETTNGRIEVSVPKDFAADVDASTTNGSIKSDLPVTTRSIDDNSLRGSINGGGTQLRLRTTNGGISIRRSS
jgi:Putative adhesin